MASKQREGAAPAGFAALHNGVPTQVVDLPVDERVEAITKAAAKTATFDLQARERVLGALVAAAVGLPAGKREVAEAAIAEARSRPAPGDGAGEGIPRMYVPHIREVDRKDGSNPLREVVQALPLHEKSALSRLLMDQYLRAKRPIAARRGYQVKGESGGVERVPPLTAAEVQGSVQAVGAWLAACPEPRRAPLVERLREARGRAPKRINEVIDAIPAVASGGRP